MSALPAILRRRRRNGGESYSVLGFRPDLVFDFDAERYRTSGSTTTFSSAITHSASSNATMVDSDGLLKWRPHNLLDYSQTFDTGWTASNMTVSANSAVAPNGTTTAATLTGAENALSRVSNVGTAGQSGSNVSLGLFVKAGTAPYMTLRLYDGAVGHTVSFDTSDWSTAASIGASNIVSTALADGWQYIAFDVASPGPETTFEVSVQDTAGYSSDGSAGTLYVWGAHLYRSDLGGMVNNPDRGDSYVPTTSAAVYLPRRGHHVYNGTSWVNEGLLHESEQRVNSIEYSRDLDLGVWNLSSGTIAKDAVGIDGVSNSAWTLTAGEIIYDVTIADDTATHATSLFVKKSTGTVPIRARLLNGTPLDFRGDLDTATGSITPSQNATSDDVDVEDWGDYWRAYVRCTNNGTGNNLLRWTLGNAVTTFVADQAQVELNTSVASSPIPTSGSTATRDAETLTVPAANLPYSATAMSIQMDGRVTFADNENNSEAQPFQWAESANNYNNSAFSTLNANVGTSNVGEFRYAFRSSGGSLESHFSGVELAVGINKQFSFATRALGNGTTGGVINIAQSGTAATETAFTATGGVLPDLDTTDLTLGLSYNGTIRKFRMWDEDLGDTGIEEASGG